MKIILIYERAGKFAENKDVARDIRLKDILPALERHEDITLDFSQVGAATQSFIHALISDVFRTYGAKTLDRITFKSCNETVQKIIAIVADYMQDGDMEAN